MKGSCWTYHWDNLGDGRNEEVDDTLTSGIRLVKGGHHMKTAANSPASKGGALDQTSLHHDAVDGANQ